MKKAALLAAGEGLRLKKINPFKPIVKINGTPLLEITYKNLHLDQFPLVCIIFNKAHRFMDLSKIDFLSNPGVNYFFKSTKSSMHSLFEVAQKLKIEKGEHLFCSMVDSIVLPEDAERFHHFTEGIGPGESGILATPYIEDENPLTLNIDSENRVLNFQSPLTDGVLVTSGVYYFSSDVFPLLEKMINEGQIKMRTFLTELVKHNHTIKVFVVEKTMDVDRPEDLESARQFLQENSL